VGLEELLGISDGWCTAFRRPRGEPAKSRYTSGGNLNKVPSGSSVYQFAVETFDRKVFNDMILASATDPDQELPVTNQ
jgi:hypothetical protein